MGAYGALQITRRKIRVVFLKKSVDENHFCDYIEYRFNEYEFNINKINQKK